MTVRCCKLSQYSVHMYSDWVRLSISHYFKYSYNQFLLQALKITNSDQNTFWNNVMMKYPYFKTTLNGGGGVGWGGGRSGGWVEGPSYIFHVKKTPHQ